MPRTLPLAIALASLLALPVCAREIETESQTIQHAGRVLDDPALIGDDVDISTLRSAAAKMASAIFDEINAQRAEHGLAPLQLDEKLSLAAESRLRDMYTRQYFAHNDPEGKRPFAAIEAAGYRYRDAGENLAKGFTHGRAVVIEWMESPGHRANVLGTTYEDVGIAIAPGAPGGERRAATVVVLFGRD